MEYNIAMLGELAILAGVPVLRSACGWAVKALEDAKVTQFEWKQLATTVIRVGLIGIAGYFGLNLAGFEVPALAAGFGAILVDKLFGALKENKNVTRR